MKYNNNMLYNEKTNKWYKKSGGSGWLLKDKCQCCGEKYFTRSDKPSNFCSHSCRNKGKNNPMYGKTHTNEVKNILRETIKKTYKTIKKTYGVDNISQIDFIKHKKNQTVLNKEYIFNYVKQYGYKLLDKDDKTNKKTIMILQCPNNHIIKMTYNSFRRGCRCKECYYDSLRNKYGIDNLNDYYEYKKFVVSLTEKTYRKYKNIINPLNLKRGKNINDYHLDHKFSILQGYKENISPYIISSCVNLEMLTCKQNESKQDKCSISKEMLLESYDKFINNNI